MPGPALLGVPGGDFELSTTDKASTPSIIQLDKVTSPALFMGSLPQQTLVLLVDPVAPQPAIGSYK